MRILLLATLALALIVAGCGGSAKNYTLNATRPCLEENGYDVFTKLNVGTRGTLWFTIGGKDVALYYFMSSSEASAKLGNLPENIYRQRNVVVRWDFNNLRSPHSPSDSEKAFVNNCLKS